MPQPHNLAPDSRRGGFERAPNVSSRRKPAHESVSLRRVPHPQPGLQGHQNQHLAVPGRPRSAASSLINNRDSSGESSNVETWFESSNNNPVTSKHSQHAQDADPPFYLRNNSSSDSPPDNSNSANALSLPYRPYLPPIVSNGSSSEEYRSVIDDLTVQNKKLKRRLRKYERIHDPHLQSDRLFEVRVHGLPEKKRRELEETLRQFALGLGQSPSAGQSSSRGPSTSQSASNAASNSVAPGAMKPSSSMTSTRVADSGYGSMSVSKTASQQASNTNNSSNSRNMHQQGFAENQQQRDRNIRHYLHDIPEGLLPRPPNVMTEKAKKKLVVRRLEQIFGGRGPQQDMSEQSQQQQEISQSASLAERSRLEADGKPYPAEGMREARIMPNGSDEPMDITPTAAPAQKIESSPRPRDKIETNDFATTPQHVQSPFPEQRPTRPLDLDPFRAQVPSDNVEYFRHLGFVLPENFQGSPIDDQGWIYLNLLMNMAQLHTINVTPEFVKIALTEYSDRFELSPDGRKVRWRGGAGFTSSHSSAGTGGGANSPLFASHERPRTGLKRARSSFNILHQPEAKKPALQPRESSFLYTPLFPRHDSDEDASMADDESYTSLVPEDVTGDSSGLASTAVQARAGRRPDDGPMIFYNNAPFCTDLSGDRIKPTPQTIANAQAAFTSQALGQSLQSKARFVHRQFPISTRGSQADSAPGDTGRYFNSEANGLNEAGTADPWMLDDVQFPEPVASPKHVSFADGSALEQFEVSGLGGCQPADHFSVTVMRQIGPLHRAQQEFPLGCVPRSRVDGLLARKQTINKAESKVLSARKNNLEPSALPPASYAFDDEDSDDDSDDSDSDDEGDSEDSSSDDEEAETRHPPLLQGGFHSSVGESRDETHGKSDARSISSEIHSDEGESGSGDDEDEDQSVDFLALARQVDPQAIRAREREYDAEMAERLADEIPAGSSAATAGGGSGFNSPMEVDKNGAPDAYSKSSVKERKR